MVEIKNINHDWNNYRKDFFSDEYQKYFGKHYDSEYDYGINDINDIYDPNNEFFIGNGSI